MIKIKRLLHAFILLIATGTCASPDSLILVKYGAARAIFVLAGIPAEEAPGK